MGTSRLKENNTWHKQKEAFFLAQAGCQLLVFIK